MCSSDLWNKFAQTAREGALRAREDLRAPALRDLAALDDAGFRALFSGSPVKRTGRNRFVRNVMIAIGNSGDESLAGCARALLDDESPLVRGAAVWALARLSPGEAKKLRASREAKEKDSSVKAEWALAV